MVGHQTISDDPQPPESLELPHQPAKHPLPLLIEPESPIDNTAGNMSQHPLARSRTKPVVRSHDRERHSERFGMQQFLYYSSDI